MGLSLQANAQENKTEINQLANFQQEGEHQLQVQECKHSILQNLLMSTFNFFSMWTYPILTIFRRVKKNLREIKRVNVYTTTSPKCRHQYPQILNVVKK